MSQLLGNQFGFDRGGFRVYVLSPASRRDVLLGKNLSFVPLTADIAEARELVQAAQAKNVILQVGHLERFNPAIRRLEGIVKEPKFVECHRLAPFVERGTDVDVVLDLMIHDIDVIASLVRAPIQRVEAVGVYAGFSDGEVRKLLADAAVRRARDLRCRSYPR